MLVFFLDAVLSLTLLVPTVPDFRKIKSKGDRNFFKETGISLKPLRAQAAQLTALLSMGLLTALKGWAGTESFMPLWGAIPGVSLYGYPNMLLKRLRKAFQPD